MDVQLTSRQIFLLAIAEAFKKGNGVVVTLYVDKFPDEVIVVFKHENLKELVPVINAKFDQRLFNADETIRVARYAELKQGTKENNE